MYIILNAMRRWLTRLAAPARTTDPMAAMSPRELADLPVFHPPCDPCRG